VILVAPRLLPLTLLAGVAILGSASSTRADGQTKDETPDTGTPDTERGTPDGGDPGDASDTQETVLQAPPFDPLTCKRGRAPSSATNAMPVTWSDFEITGQLVDPPDTVRALLAPTMERHRALTEDMRDEIDNTATAIGYHVVGLGTKETPTGIHAQLFLAPLPIVRKLDVHIKQPVLDVLGTPLFEDEVKRRMRLRQGSYLRWAPDERQCELYEEKRRIEDFLHDEGYFDAVAAVVPKIDGVRVTVIVRVVLGEAYATDVDKIFIPDDKRLPIGADEIRAYFKHHGTCLFGQHFCFGRPRWQRQQQAADVQKVIQRFHALQYPAVRVRSSDPLIDRSTHSVEFTLTIDPRRRVETVFEGDFTVPVDQLDAQLTFNDAQSADDVEAAASAGKITAFFQSRGNFDARVTWRREQFPDAGFDRLIYRIAQGRERTVRSVTFRGNLALDPDRQVAERRLLDAIVTKPVGRTAKLLGARAAATADNLIADVERLRALYRQAGYRDARVAVSASTTNDPAALTSAALTAALVGAERGDDLYIQFSIDAGQPTHLTHLHIELGPSGDETTTVEERELCQAVLSDLADLYHQPGLARPESPDHCVGSAPDLLYRELDVVDTRDLLKERLFNDARPRTEVELETKEDRPYRYIATYRLRNTQQLKVGKIVLRGNFRTRDSIIRGELAVAHFKEGMPLTASALAESTRKLRNTGLFDSVNVRLLDLDTTSAGALNAVVEVTERYDYRAALDVEAGYSSFNGAFVKVLPTFRNLFGIGISLDTSGTLGFDVGDLVDQTVTIKQLAAEATLRIPEWLSRRAHIPLQPQIELTGFHRRQDTPRFGVLRTTGVSATLSRTWSFAHVGSQAAHAFTFGSHYDYRSRERNVDVLRPVGADSDESQVPITTITGSVGLFLEWEHRNDRAGSLQPLAPEAGFQLEGQLSFAHPLLSAYFGSDTFVKASAVGSKYWSPFPGFVLRGDLRYDHGIPLGGAALLPEVERFFAGGDSTVRGYQDDRLATELVQVAVPPLDNITQIRVLPAGGNIRALCSVDAQLRIFKLFSTALFADAGLITNQWSTVTIDDIRPSVGMALVRIVTPFGAFAFERAVPLHPRLGDDPRGRWHISFAARAQF